MDSKKLTVMLPFSEKLRVDKDLKLSNNDFKQSIRQFYANKQISAIDQLNATHPYPTPHVLVQFATMAYKDYKHTEPKPPDGWQLLTTASKSGITNGYFGAAYWHPEHQQVVIAHRGTAGVGAVVTDLKGVLFNNYVDQISSASTFANKVVTVLQEIEQGTEVSFELFFTGHSLGGWLAQITTFTTEYLKVKGGTFLKKQKTEQVEPPASRTVQDSHDVTHSYHPHTVVFDSPGCKDMLSQMSDKLDVRLQGRSIDLQHLDITSYLSAPNLINTCNSHLGTVYRIFIDLSDMGWKEKHTLLYNTATHCKDKILQAFDPATGQVRKDDKGKPKIREVVDWPLSAGLTYGKELNDFFELASHLNNYHPEEMDTDRNEVPKAYHLLRYQTKAYNENTNSLSVFTQDERELLVNYMSLREVQTQLNVQVCFSVMSNTDAENTAKQNLQEYKFENESVRCKDASTLQTLIPYVKRLVRLFPHVIKNIKDKLSPPHIMNMVFQHETRRNIEKIPPSALEFQSGVVGLTEFLESDQQLWQLRMVDGDVLRGITRVNQALQNTNCTSNYRGVDNCTVLTLGWLLTVNGIINLNALLVSKESPHLLIIACGSNQPVTDELENMFQKLFNILKEKKNVKIILTTPSDDDITDLIQEIATEILGEGFLTIDERLTWSDLTASAQRQILEKTVIFQGRPVALHQLRESITDSFPLADLLQEKVLRIGKELVTSASSGYNEKYYIDRTFNHNIVIKQDILSDERARKFADILASTEQKFQQLCQENPQKNVHWLEKDKSGELMWQQSQGNLKILHEYIDTQKSHSYAPSDLDKLLQQAKHQKVMLIADKAGMGKTTVLTHLSKLIKQQFPAHWLVRIDLNDYTKLLEAQKGKKMDKETVLEFVSKKVLKLKSHLEMELFKNCFEGNETNKAVVIVDGFDEISPKYKQTVIDMLKILKETSLEQLWVTTRSHLREELEDILQQLSYTLQPFSECEQVEFLKKIWFHDSNNKAMKPHQLEIYAKKLIKKLAQSISDNNKEFTGIPLQTRMLAEAFMKESKKSKPELPHKLDLVGLYRRFFERKYRIYWKYKCRTPGDNVGAGDIRKRDVRNIKLDHQLLALQTLFTEDQVTFVQSYHHSKFSVEELCRIGIVQRNQEGRLQFIHRTVAEYFVAEFLINYLKKKNKQQTQLRKFLLNEVLLADHHIIRVFLDGLLKGSKLADEALKEVGKEIEEQWKEKEKQGTQEGATTAFHEAAKEDNVHIVGFLLNSLKSGKHLSTVTHMLLYEDSWGQTAWHKAAENDSVQALTTIWEWAKKVTAWQAAAARGQSEASDTTRAPAEEEELRTNQIKNKLFLAKDHCGNTAWHGAAQRGSLKALEILWSWTNEAGLNPHDLLLAKNEEENTAWQVAVQRGHSEVLEKIWDWAKKAEINLNDLKNKFLLAKDEKGYTVWNRAAESGSLDTLQTLWLLGKEAKLKSDEMFLAQSTDENTAWQVATQRGHFKVLEKLWEWAKLEKMGEKVLKDMLLTKDKNGNTAWHRAADRGNLKSLEKLRSWATEVELNQYELYELLLVHNEAGLTAWHLAADRDHFQAFEKMWEWAKDAQNIPKYLKKKLFLAKDQYGYNVWHRAAQRGNLVELETLWGWAKSATKPIVASPK